MAGDQDQSRKTEEPTPHKLRKSREKGQIPKSNEVVSAASLVITLGIVIFSIGWVATSLMGLFHGILDSLQEPFPRAMKQSIVLLKHTLIVASLPAVLGALVVGILANVAQFGFLFSVDPIKPDINKINPFEGAKKLFGRKKVIEIFKAITKICIIGLVAALVVRHHLNDLGNIAYCGLYCGVEVARRMLVQAITALIPLFIILAVIDYRFQRAEFMREQRMTKEEVKRENKDTEGNPEVRSERRSRQQEQVSDDLRSKAAQATAVLTDGKIVITIYYDENDAPVPRVTLREREHRARQVLRVADRHGRPVVEDAALARELWKQVEADQNVPRDMFDDVAKILVAANQGSDEEQAAED